MIMENSQNSFLVVKKSPFIISDTIDDLVIVIHINSGAYYSLTKKSSDVWIKIEASENEFDEIEVRYIKGFVDEQILMVQESLETIVPIEFSELATKYNDMEELFLGDPIHGVDEQGWPAIKLDK
jgi:predicted ATP-dependent Lon-type protease